MTTRKPNPPHRHLNGLGRPPAPTTDWVGISKVKPRLYSRPLNVGEWPDTSMTWLLVVSCWHKYSKRSYWINEEVMSEHRLYALINPCRWVECPKGSYLLAPSGDGDSDS